MAASWVGVVVLLIKSNMLNHKMVVLGLVIMHLNSTPPPAFKLCHTNCICSRCGTHRQY